MRTLVTGGAGFIGSHIVDALVGVGHEVSVIDNLSTGLKENVNPQAKFYKVDILDERGLERIFKKERPEAVFHLAAQIDLRQSIDEPVFDSRVNILGSLSLLECARDYKVKKFVFSSTGGAIYGEAKRIPTPESSPANPASPYGLAKLTVEKYLEIWQQLYGLEYIALRYSNVYGPRQRGGAESGVVAIFATKALKGDSIAIYGDGEQTRDYVYIEDAMGANLAALESKKSGVYNIGTSMETTVNEVFTEISNLVGSEVEATRTAAIKGELLRSALDCSKAKKDLDWEPQISLGDGLKGTLDFFRGKLNV
ncbi:MAG TPA: NAD-dependent epimerase/dehydratase family protein [candidate division WWE3 bacterium]|uniref:NAD-dependent epimerase/dehydratase family protein n=1 Tax=candidate division WWE3 bacterium TaxID=2053526 RepID=A0A7C1SP63_UNCKA|nr:NAD-dependent epimerase/dehydratase family protein [candidate division WWE3 bacterium]